MSSSDNTPDSGKLCAWYPRRHLKEENAATRQIMNDRAAILFTFTDIDIFNDCFVEREIDGQGFTALYQNLLETQVATARLRVRF